MRPPCHLLCEVSWTDPQKLAQHKEIWARLGGEIWGVGEGQGQDPMVCPQPPALQALLRPVLALAAPYHSAHFLGGWLGSCRKAPDSHNQSPGCVWHKVPLHSDRSWTVTTSVTGWGWIKVPHSASVYRAPSELGQHMAKGRDVFQENGDRRSRGHTRVVGGPGGGAAGRRSSLGGRGWRGPRTLRCAGGGGVGAGHMVATGACSIRSETRRLGGAPSGHMVGFMEVG